MLIEINLAPGGAGGGRLRRMPALSLPNMPSLGGDMRSVAGVVVGILVLAALVWGYLRMDGRAQALEREIDAEVADSLRFASTIDLITSLQARQDTMQQKIDIIRSVDTRRYVWPHLLDEISQAVPAFTWLTEIRTTAPVDSLGVGPSFAIQGNAGSTQALTRFMTNLETSLFIGDVTLVTSEQDELEGRTIQRFSLEARYQQPPRTALETVPVVILEE